MWMILLSNQLKIIGILNKLLIKLSLLITIKATIWFYNKPPTPYINTGEGGVIIILYLPNPTPQNVNLVYLNLLNSI